MYYAGVDLGATNVRAVVGDESATVLGEARGSTPDGSTGEAVTEAVLNVVRAACDDAGVAPGSVAGAAVGAMGKLDVEAGVADVPANLADDVGPIPLVDPLAALLDTADVHLCSDTLAGALGERFHAHPDVDDLVYLTISSGIGAGVVADGDPLSGWNGNAGEVGHVAIDADGRMTCGCGRPGHWEAYCSGNNVPRFARALHEEEGLGTDLPLDSDGFTAKDVFDAAGADPLADRVVERVAALNTLGTAAVVHAYAPEVVAVGGAVALSNPDLVVAPIRERLPDAVVVDAPAVEPSSLGADAGLRGALVYAVTGGTGDPADAPVVE